MRLTICLVIVLTAAWPSGKSGAWMAIGQHPLESPHWLSGCWEMSVGDLVVEEQWMAYRAGSMLGMSRSLRGGELRGYELILLREEGERWVYEAHPSGQPPAFFKSVAVDDTSAIFSNPDHDFPQTIAYFKASSDSLVARIAGVQNGRQLESEFAYRRVSCPGRG